MIFAEDRLQIEQVDHLIDKLSSFDSSQSPNQVRKDCLALLVCKVNHLSDQIIFLPEGRRTKLIKCLQETMKKHGQCFDEKIHRMTMKIIEDDSIRLKASNISSNAAESSNTLALEQVATPETSKDASSNEQINRLETFSQKKQSCSKKTTRENNESSQAPCTLTSTSQTREKEVHKSYPQEKCTNVEQHFQNEARSTSRGICEKESCRKLMSIEQVKKYIEPISRRKRCSELISAPERQQTSSSKQVLQLLSDAESFKGVKVETFHIFAPEHIMFFEEESCGRFIKKTMAIPKKYFGRIIGIKGTTVQILEVLTNTVISIKQPPMSNYWRYLVAAGRCHFEVNNLISLIHFLLKYNVDFDIKTISSICRKLTWLEIDRNNPSHLLSGIKDKQDRSKRKTYEKQTDSEREDLATASVCHSMEEENGSCRNRTPNLSISGSREIGNICSCKGNKQKSSGRTRHSSTNCAFLTDCIQVKNSHVGRIMGTKGSIIAIIEHFSNTVISFKDTSDVEGNRMVCIKGQRQKDIECAKEFIHLIIFHSIRFGLITDQLVSRAVNATEKQMKSEQGVYEISFRNSCRISDREWVPNGIKQLVRTVLSKEEPGEWNCANCVQFRMPCAKVQIQKASKGILRKNERNQWDRNRIGSSENTGQQKKDFVQSWDHNNQEATLRKREDCRSTLPQECASSNATTAERLRLALQTIKATHVFSGNGCNHENTSIAQREQFLLAEMTPDAIMPFNEYWESKCNELGISRGRAHDNPLP